MSNYDLISGLVIKPRRTYSQVVTKTFHVSQATLDVSSCTNNNNDVKLIVKIEPFDNEYILCVLNKSQAVQAPLDLIFSHGDEISFHSVGKFISTTRITLIELNKTFCLTN